MKICNHCQAENADELLICAACGAALEEAEAEPAETTVEMETAEFDTEAPAEEELPAEEGEAAEEGEEAAEEGEPAGEQPKKKKTGLIVGLIIAAVLIVGLVVGKILYDRNQAEMKGNAHHINAYGYDSHSIHYTDNGDGTFAYDIMNKNAEPVSLAQSDVDALLDQEVASCGGLTLTNRDLMYYYEEQYYSFTQTYAAYMSFLMDPSKGLDEQLGMEEGKTWQQFFLNAAIDTFHQFAAISAYAESHDFPITDAMREQAETLRSSIEEMAEVYEIGTGEQYLQATFGPGATLDSYLNYCLLGDHVNKYISSLQASKIFTDEELEAYYDENAQMLQEQYGLQKIDKNVVSVRHILIQPEIAEGETEPSAEAWTAAETEAQRIYDEWLAGEASETTFAELAVAYTQDAGSQSKGGQYNGVYPGQMVPEFNDWCFADGRQSGDHGIVKTDYGYHMMYFCSEGSYIYWQMAVESMLFDQWLGDEIANMQAAYPLTVDAGKIVLLDLAAPTIPAPEAEAETAETVTE